MFCNAIISLVSFPDHSPTPPLRRWGLGTRLQMSSLLTQPCMYWWCSASQHCSSCSNADGAQGNNLIPSLCTGIRIQHLYFYTQKTQGTQCTHEYQLFSFQYLTGDPTLSWGRSGETSPNLWACFRNLEELQSSVYPTWQVPHSSDAMRHFSTPLSQKPFVPILT